MHILDVPIIKKIFLFSKEAQRIRVKKAVVVAEVVAEVCFRIL